MEQGGAPGAGGTELLFRGVSAYHPGFEDALQGIADPRSGSATPAEHNLGNTASEFTSWTRDVFTAQTFAGEDGVVLMKEIPKTQMVDSPDIFGEQEILVRGKITQATVFKK